ncbi:MarR family winged helix-turn-helix transcriptional regulator [Nitratireductor kimnyeongensis]|uniref:HTH-type transcriptional regulator SarZ n=1 Tax=Nitratireductor kimnyeongensis TaxID=430679 RepID=A0ABW0T5F8_9HYPH|nr:MarR family winged helix-turn-helix transcriptional regulator [Nitratireductor kimnyeongensis]QZZ34409.1 MarR family winged helix-turn-helix transcriptional regulator [Nitratireductor kimnyeongensis]
MTSETTTAKVTKGFRDEELRGVEKCIRRIVRANDVHSRALAKQIGLTAPQLIILKAIAALGEVTTTVLSAHVDLSAATVITVLDNLETRLLVERYRSRHDRRVVHTRLTEQGRVLLKRAPEPMGDAFGRRFAALAPERRSQLISALTTIADIMAPKDDLQENTLRR